jgi:TRAP-type mannitol/chloroaromatic compound transport system substrate-binding protein
MAGPGAEILRRLGAIVVTLPGSEIMPALKSGAIEASEWIGPWLDVAMGLQTLLYPGFHEPAAGQTFGVNKAIWESFDANDRQIIEAIAAAEYARSLAEFNANNAFALRKLRDEGAVKILKFDDSLLKAFLEISNEVIAEVGSGDELSRKIYASSRQFRSSIMDWTDISERAYMNSRALVLICEALAPQRPAHVDSHFLAVGPAQFLQALEKCCQTGLSVRLVRGHTHEHADAGAPPAASVLGAATRSRR